jgi:serine/threonine protein kinase
MTPHRRGRIKDVFGAAFERPEAKRADFLDSACEGDVELRAEVERLLKESEVDSLHSPVSGFFNAEPDLAPGDTVAHYRIQEKLGEGGMGVVYKASDSRLGRSVALKVVKTEFSSRSQREARAVAALNHPNICTLHDVGPDYLVMELVEGPTLAERIAKGPIPIPEALDIARQIADALEAAHEKGIVHRDLKPTNIKFTAEGKVKVLDFGLAKALAPGGSPEDSPALTVSGRETRTTEFHALSGQPKQGNLRSLRRPRHRLPAFHARRHVDGAAV